jgi:hypothetical protein
MGLGFENISRNYLTYMVSEKSMKERSVDLASCLNEGERKTIKYHPAIYIMLPVGISPFPSIHSCLKFEASILPTKLC